MDHTNPHSATDLEGMDIPVVQSNTNYPIEDLNADPAIASSTASSTTTTGFQKPTLLSWVCAPGV